MYFPNVVGTRSYTTSTTNMYHKDFTYQIDRRGKKSRQTETYKMRTSEIFVMRQKQQQEKQENIKLEIEKKEFNPGVKKEPEAEELINFEAEEPVTIWFQACPWTRHARDG